MKRRMVMYTLLAAAAAIGLVAQPALAAASIVQPTQSFAGNTYPEWTTRWWQWAFTLTDPNPFTDPSGASCGAGQGGQVWFLGGQFGETSPNCTIPHGK